MDIRPQTYQSFIGWERPIQVVAELLAGPRAVILDVGANTGGLAVALSRIGGSVLAFECHPDLVRWAAEEIRLNGSTNAELVPKAVFSRAGEYIQFFCEDSSYAAGSSLLRDGSDSPGKLVTVETTTIDDECERRNLDPTLIKIDVEGAERHVLLGGVRTIGRTRPIVILEYSSTATKEDPFDLLISRGYRLYRLHDMFPFVPGEDTQDHGINVLALPSGSIGRSTFMDIRCSPAPSVAVFTNGSPLVVEAEITSSEVGTGLIEVFADDQLVNVYQSGLQHLRHPSCSSAPIAAPSSSVAVQVRADEGWASIVGLRLSNWFFVPD